MRTPRSKALVVELLRTLEDARTDGSLSSTDGGGVRQMPVLYNHGSYKELERCLSEMRDNGKRREWWHISMRYRWGDPDHTIVVQSRKTRQGRVPVLPDRTELRIQGETLDKGLMVVTVYTWNPRVEPAWVERGIDTLTRLMYGGQWWRLTLPDPFRERLSDVEPWTSQLSSPALSTA